MFSCASKILTMTVVGTLILGGCAGLPDGTDPTSDGLTLIHESRSLRIATRPGFDLQQYSGLTLGAVRIRDDGADTEEQQERDDLRAQFEQHLTALVNPVPKNSLRMDVELYDIRPVMPALNLLTTVALFLPLDSGALTLDIVFYDTQGIPQVRRVERLTGSITDIVESFSRYGRLHTALEVWAAQCAQWQICVMAEGMPTIETSKGTMGQVFSVN